MASSKEVSVILQKLMKFETTSNNSSELTKCANFIMKFFSGKNFVVRKHVNNGKISIVVLFEKTKSPEIFLNAHFDVVPAEKSMFKPKVKSGRLYGRGSLDCKAQVAVLMLLMKELSTIPKSKRPSVGLMFSGDEETGGMNGVNSLLNKEGYKCKFAIVADGGKNFNIVTRHKAILHVKLKAEGKASHGSRPWQGDNAADKAIAAYEDIRKLFPSAEQLGKRKDKWVSTINLGSMKSGDVVNRVPDSAEMHLDIRCATNPEAIRKKVRKAANKHKGVSLEVGVASKIFNTANNNSYVKELKSVVESVTKKKVDFLSEHGSTDARFFSAKNIPVAIVWSIGEDIHANNEYVEIESLGKLYQIFKTFTLSCTR
jgi:succinyl-diaminopimelate desuccinylase